METKDDHKIESAYLDNTFDENLKKIPGLKWLPWIGVKYLQNKFLIVGESHYDDGDDWFDYTNPTRELINLFGLLSRNPAYGNCAVLRNIEKTVYNKSQISYEERERLWSSVSYFNLVQRILPSRKYRPDEKDFDYGWEKFFKIVEIIKPKFVLKCGMSGDGRFGNMLTNNNPGWKYEDKEYYSIPRVMNLSRDNCQFKLLFINHPSGSFGYSFEEWGGIIQRQFPEFINSLSEKYK